MLESSRAGDTSDEDSDSSDGSIESEDIEEEYLSLKQVVEALETFYGLKKKIKECWFLKYVVP